MDDSSTLPLGIGPLPGLGDGAARAAALVVMRGPEVGRRYVLTAGRTLIGRRPDNAVAIEHQSLSRRHCEIELAGSMERPIYRLRELGSTNGTYVNGRRVEEVELADGDRLTLGEVILKFVLSDTLEEAFHDEVSDLLRTDRVTGLLNMKAFYSELDAALAYARTEQRPVGLLMLDIDGLKGVNDKHGHLVGTDVIRTVADCIRTACASTHTVAALYGGDEFIAYTSGAGEAAAFAVGEQIRQSVAARSITAADGHSIGVTVSGGVAEYPRDGSVREVLVRRVDLALYAAKNDGRNRIVPFRADLEDRAQSARRANT